MLKVTAISSFCIVIKIAILISLGRQGLRLVVLLLEQKVAFLTATEELREEIAGESAHFL